MHRLEEVYRVIQPKVFAFFYLKTGDTAIAEDLTQDVFYQAMKGINTFRGTSSLETWIFAIAKNRLKTYYRSKKYTKSLQEKLKNHRPTPVSTPESVYLSKEQASTFHRHIEQLSDTEKEIVILRLYGELSFKEIGELMNKTENYARVVFHRAKIKIQKEMRVSDE